MTLPGDVLRAAATDLPATDNPWGWLTARAHNLDHTPGFPCTEACPYAARLVTELARHRALPVNTIRLEHGLPLLPDQPAPGVVTS